MNEERWRLAGWLSRACPELRRRVSPLRVRVDLGFRRWVPPAAGTWRRRRLRPDFSHAEWNCRHPVGGETCDGVELCERFVLGSSSNRESFSPSAFSAGGEGAEGG